MISTSNKEELFSYSCGLLMLLISCLTASRLDIVGAHCHVRKFGECCNLQLIMLRS